jgi:hypothetical protein
MVTLTVTVSRPLFLARTVAGLLPARRRVAHRNPFRLRPIDTPRAPRGNWRRCRVRPYVRTRFREIIEEGEIGRLGQPDRALATRGEIRDVIAHGRGRRSCGKAAGIRESHFQGRVSYPRESPRFRAGFSLLARRMRGKEFAQSAIAKFSGMSTKARKVRSRLAGTKARLSAVNRDSPSSQ